MAAAVAGDLPKNDGVHGCGHPANLSRPRWKSGATVMTATKLKTAAGRDQAAPVMHLASLIEIGITVKVVKRGPETRL